MAATVETKTHTFASITFMDFARELGYALGEAFRRVWQAEGNGDFAQTDGVKESIKYFRDALITRYTEVSEEVGNRLMRRLSDLAGHFNIDKFCLLQVILLAAKGDYQPLNQWMEQFGQREQAVSDVIGQPYTAAAV